jgi:urease accessory protein
MLRLTAVLGDVADPSIASRIDGIARAGGLETLRLGRNDMSRRRLHGRTERGTEVALMLDRDAPLSDGAVILLEPARAIVVRLDAPCWLTVRAAGGPQALQLGYFAGSMHWKVRFDGLVLSVAMDGPREHYLARLAPMLEEGAVTLGEDVVCAAAPVAVPAHDHGHGHGHDHDHGHDHGHDHDHGTSRGPGVAAGSAA